MSVVTDLIAQINTDLELLRRGYTQFLSDQAREPHELRQAMERRVRQLKGFTNLRTEEKFRTQNMVSKVNSLLALWDKQVERKYEGKPRRPRPTPPPEDKKQEDPHKKAVKKEAPTPTFLIANAAQQRGEVVKLYDEYMRLNILLGSRKMINFGKFQAFINSQTQKIQRTKKVDKVQYQVSVKDDQVVIKSKSIK